MGDTVSTHWYSLDDGLSAAEFAKGKWSYDILLKIWYWVKTAEDGIVQFLPRDAYA